MSCYICYLCGNHKDADFDGCYEHKETELICEDCYEDATKANQFP